MGLIEIYPELNEGKTHLNIYIPEGVLYYRCHPTTHVLCAICRAKVKRTKIIDHIQQTHGDILAQYPKEDGIFK